MGKGKSQLLIVIAVVLVAAAVAGVSFFPDEPDAPPLAASGNTIHMDLGITYLAISPGISERNGLDIENGALITEIYPGSPADLAGIRAGDIILSLNGIQPGEEAPLLGMMMACPVDEPMTLEIARQGEARLIKLYDE